MKYEYDGAYINRSDAGIYGNCILCSNVIAHWQSYVLLISQDTLTDNDVRICATCLDCFIDYSVIESIVDIYNDIYSDNMSIKQFLKTMVDNDGH